MLKRRGLCAFSLLSINGKCNTRTATTASMLPATTASNSEQLNRSPTNCALSAFPEPSLNCGCDSVWLGVCVRVCLCALFCFYHFRAVGVVVVVVSTTMRHQ